MKRYCEWVYRLHGKSSVIADEHVMVSIRHLIKCTSVRRHFCNNNSKWILVRENDSDVLSRPVFKVFTEDQQFKGVIYPLVVGEESDTNVLEQYIDAIDSSLTAEIASHIESAVVRRDKQSIESPQENKEQIKEPSMSKKVKQTKPVAVVDDNRQTTVISLIGEYGSMLPLVSQVASVIRGSTIQMTVVNSMAS